MERADVAVVGGGAAGLATAVFAARARPGLDVRVLDGARQLGAKVLISGGARCNVTNTRVVAEDFWTRAPFVRRLLSAFTAEQARAFFEELGVALHEEEDGKLFPDTHKARTVLNALLAECERLGVALLTSNRVTAIAPDEGGFQLATSNGDLAAQRVVLATGGLSLPKTGSDGGGYALARALGHSITATTPALVPLVLDGDFHVPLSGVAVEAEIALQAPDERVKRLRGSLLFTHFGLSGPLALNASRFWLRGRLEGRDVSLTLSLLPGVDFASAEAWLLAQAREAPRGRLGSALARRLPASLAAALVAEVGLAPELLLAQLRRDDRRKLVRALVERPLPVRDSRGYGYAEVTAGGIPLVEVDPATMESRVRPGLHLVGEILDVDGRIGGFNFQWSWSTGYVAGQALARSLGARMPRPIVIEGGDG